MIINAIIQARMGSTRLPGKILTCIEGKPLLMHIVERLVVVKDIQNVIIATSNKVSDDAVEKFCNKNNYICFRGSESNVLDRFFKAAKKYPADIYIRATGDNPMIDPELVKQIITFFTKKDLLYASCKGYPLGSGAEIFNSFALYEAYKNAEQPYELEHVTPYMYQKIDNSKVDYLRSNIDLSNIRVTIDTIEDFKFASEIFARLYMHNQYFGVADIHKLLKVHPELMNINCNVHQKGLYE